MKLERHTREHEWPYGEHSRLVRVGALTWHVQRAGAGPALLLVHGTGASSHSFEALIPRLAQRFSVLAVDLPGHALSNAPRSFTPSLPLMAAAIHDLLVRLAVEPVLAIGHSAGAAIVLRMALDRSIDPALLIGLAPALLPFPRLSRVVLSRVARVLAGAAQRVSLPVGSHAQVTRVLGWTGAELDASAVESYRRLWARPNHVAGTLSMLAHWNLEPLFAELPRLRVPLVLMAGERDRAIPPAQVHQAAARVPGARVLEIAGAGHLLHEELPETIARLIFDAAQAVATHPKPQGSNA